MLFVRLCLGLKCRAGLHGRVFNQGSSFVLIGVTGMNNSDRESLVVRFLKQLFGAALVVVVFVSMITQGNAQSSDNASAENASQDGDDTDGDDKNKNADKKDDAFSLSLEELSNISVRSIDFFESSLTRSPNNITLLTHEDLVHFPVRTIDELIQFTVPGAAMIRHGLNGPNFSSRGVFRGGSTKGLVMWDGRRLNTRHGEGFQMGFYSQLFGDLEQVEVVLGPGSVVHGNNAFHGFVNFVPKSGVDHPGNDLRVRLGTTDKSIRLENGFGHRYGEEKHFYVYGGYYQADGFLFDNSFGGEFGRDNAYGYEPSYKFSANWLHEQLRVTGFYERVISDPNTLFNDNPDSTRFLAATDKLAVQARYSFDLGDFEEIEISPSATIIDQSVFRIPRFDDTLDAREDGSSEAGYELRATLQTERWDRQKITFGIINNWRDLRSRRQYFSADAIEDPNFADGKFQEQAVFVEDNIQISDKFNASIGARYDQTDYGSFEGQSGGEQLTFRPNDLSNLSPRVQLGYQPSDSHIFKLSYQEGFHYPTLSAYPRLEALNRYLDSIGEQRLNELEPDTVNSFEIGYSGRFPENRLNFDLTLYHNEYVNPVEFRNLKTEPFFLPESVINQIPDNLAPVVFNIGGSYTSVGGEMGIKWQPLPSLRTSLSYSYSVPGRLSELSNDVTNFANTSRDEWLIFPKHQLKSVIEYQSDKWTYSVLGLYHSGVDKRREEPGLESLSEDYVRVNTNIEYRFRKDWTASFMVRNLFGNNKPPTNVTSLGYFGTLGEDERTFHLGVRWRPSR